MYACPLLGWHRALVSVRLEGAQRSFVNRGWKVVSGLNRAIHGTGRSGSNGPNPAFSPLVRTLTISSRHELSIRAPDHGSRFRFGIAVGRLLPLIGSGFTARFRGWDDVRWLEEPKRVCGPPKQVSGLGCPPWWCGRLIVADFRAKVALQLTQWWRSNVVAA